MALAMHQEVVLVQPSKLEEMKFTTNMLTNGADQKSWRRRP
jgi:hypothetical protein